MCAMFIAFVFATFNKSYAENTFSEDATGTHLYVTTDVNSFSYAAGVTINEMKMTQDDSRYYISFDIDYACPSLIYDRNQVIGTGKQIGGYGAGDWDVYQSTDFGSLFVSEAPNYGIYRYVRRKYNGGSSSGGTSYYGYLTCDGKYSTWDYYDGYNSRGHYTNTYTWSGNTYYIFPNIFSGDNGDCNAYYTNGNSLSYSASGDYGVNFWKYKASGTITINKSDTTHYKYLNLCSPFAVKTYAHYYSNIGHVDTGTSDYTGVGLYATAIDISGYLMCEHDWEVENTGDKVNHKRHCKNCDWTITEPHALKYEYDGIENNMCICGYKDKLRYDIAINDDNIATLSYIVDSYGTLPDIPTPHKTGYNFDYFEKYEKRPIIEGATPSEVHNELVDVLIATCSTIELTTSNYSTVYKAHFTPIHYTFHFSNENNLGLLFDTDIEEVILEYDAPTKLPKHLHKDGYIFEGWTYATTSDVIIYGDEAMVLNHTTSDFDEYVLYPRYRVLEFTIMYKADGGRYVNGLGTYEKRYSYFDESVLEKPSPYSEEVYFRFYTTNIDNIGVPRLDERESDYNVYKDMAKVKELLSRYEYDLVILHAEFGKPDISSNERTGDDNDKAKGKKVKDILNVEDSIENYTVDDLNEPKIFGKGYKKDTKEDTIYVYDLSKTLYERLGDRISSSSYIVGYRDIKVDIGMIVAIIITFIIEHLVESLLFLILLLIIAIYVFLKS